MNINPNTPPPEGIGGDAINWLKVNVEFLKRRINGIHSGGSGGSQSLQQVTDIGNTTTNDVVIGEPDSETAVGITLSTGGGATPSIFIYNENVPQGIVLQAFNDSTSPNISMFKSLTDMVDIILADSFTGIYHQHIQPADGTIALEQTMTLQKVTDAGATSTNEIKLYSGTDPIVDLNPAGYIEVDAPGFDNGIFMQISPVGVSGSPSLVYYTDSGSLTLNMTGGGTPGNFTQVLQPTDGTIALLSDITGFLTNPMTSDLNMNSHLINNLADPSADTDGVNKRYVDTVATGLSWKTAVRVAATSALPANTYNNGASGVGATLTANANGALTIDGVAVTNGDRVLIAGESTASHNGIYTVTSAGSAGSTYVLTRATDADSGSELVSAAVSTGSEGTSNANKAYTQTTPSPITVGTDPLVWTLFLNNTLNQGTGIRISGNLIYARLSEGVTGGQTAVGGTAADDTFTIEATSSASGRTTNAPAIILGTTLGNSLTSSSAAQVFVSVPLTVNASGTAGYTAFKIAVTETATGSGTKLLLNLLAGAAGSTSKFSVANTGTVTVADGANIVVGSSTGTQIATSTSQKLGFFGASPVAQQSGDLVAGLSSLGLIAAGTISAGNITSSINTQTGTTYTFQASDKGKMVTSSNSSAQTYTVPSGVFSAGDQIDVVQVGTGKLTIAAAGGVTINSFGGLKSAAGQYVGLTLKCTAANTFLLLGNLIS